MSRRVSGRLWSLRAPRVETMEPRLLMSGQPLAPLAIDPWTTAQTSALIAPLAATDDVSGLEAARQAYGLTGRGQTVVVIDTGIAYDHQALGGGYGAGYRVVGGHDLSGEADFNPYDDGPNGSHGTHVAGIIASNDPDHLGVAPGVDLVALRVFDDSGQGRLEWVEEALRWVHLYRNSFANPVTTVNLSLGQDWSALQLNGAILDDELAQLKADGIFIAAAAGNNYAATQQPELGYPAASQYVVPVASLDPTGSLSYFSQRSPRAIAAPGRGILSSVPDYAGNRNGIGDDYARYSGTSMAAPFVAGAAVLLREAWSIAGIAGVGQDAIYQLMQNTADVYRDGASGQNVYRLNLQRALAQILPADDYGSSAQTAHGLGSVFDTLSASGAIGTRADRDYFSFTAGRTGKVTLTLEAGGSLAGVWDVAGQPGAVIGNDGSVSFDVIAGGTYSFGVGTRSGSGQYRLAGRLDARAVPAPAGPLVIGQKLVADQRITADGSRIALTASAAGILTVEAYFAHAWGDVDMQLFDSNGRLLGGSYGIGDGERLDVPVVSGQTVYAQLWVNGGVENPDVDLRVTNMVNASGDMVTLTGTPLDDSLQVDAGPTHALWVNGVSYLFDSATVRSIRVEAGGGRDSLVIRGTAADEQAEVATGRVRFGGGSYLITAAGAEDVSLVAGGGNDTVSLFDTAGDDTVWSNPRMTTVAAGGALYRAAEFEVVHVYATAGGYDTAYLEDSAGDDQLIATPAYARLLGPGYALRVKSFDAVYASAAHGGYDVARLSGSAANDDYLGTPLMGELKGQDWLNQVARFEEVTVNSGGGNDRAFLYRQHSTDQLRTTASGVRLMGAGYAHDVRRFRATYGQQPDGLLEQMRATDYLLALLG